MIFWCLLWTQQSLSKISPLVKLRSCYTLSYNFLPSTIFPLAMSWPIISDGSYIINFDHPPLGSSLFGT